MILTVCQNPSRQVLTGIEGPKVEFLTTSTEKRYLGMIIGPEVHVARELDQGISLRFLLP